MMFKGFLLEYYYCIWKCLSWKFRFRNSIALIALKMFCNSFYEEQDPWQQYLYIDWYKSFDKIIGVVSSCCPHFYHSRDNFYLVYIILYSQPKYELARGQYWFQNWWWFTNSIAENFFWLWINNGSFYVVYPWVWILSSFTYSRLKWLLPLMSGLIFYFGTRYCVDFSQISFWLNMYTTSQRRN